jgi:hypothetical protein
MSKRITLPIVTLAAGLLIGGATMMAVQVMADEPTATCPAGTYEIGRDGAKPLCKAEPTGCPYGDSIPLDSPKCAPPANPEQAYAPWQPEQPTVTPAPAEPQVKGCQQ